MTSAVIVTAPISGRLDKDPVVRKNFSTIHDEITDLQGNLVNVVSGTSYTVLDTDGSIIVNPTATFTITLPNPGADNKLRTLRLKSTAPFAVVSSIANVVLLTSGSVVGTAILAALDGRWATLQSDGTHWQVMAGN